MARASLVVAAGTIAVIIAAAAWLIGRLLKFDVNFWLTIPTALVVGVFGAFLLLGPLAPDEPEGFEVVSRETKKEPEVEDKGGPGKQD